MRCTELVHSANTNQAVQHSREALLALSRHGDVMGACVMTSMVTQLLKCANKFVDVVRCSMETTV